MFYLIIPSVCYYSDNDQKVCTPFFVSTDHPVVSTV